METIIIFTNWDRIYRTQGSYELSWVPDNNPPKKISISDNSVFIVAWDAILGFTDLVDLVNERANVYILHHTQPYKENLEQLKISLGEKKCHIKKPVQKQHNDEEYIKIQEIDACVKEENGCSFEKPNIQKLQEIFNWYLGRLGPNDKLEAALKFLHECLIEKPDDLSQLKDFDIQTRCNTGKALGKNLEELRISLGRKPIDDIETFEELRDGVLEMAGLE